MHMNKNKGKDMMTKEDFYHDYLLLREMKIPTPRKCRMLGELLSSHPDNWRVVGVTKNSLIRFKEHDFFRESRMGINRSHIVDRNKTFKTMLEGPLMDCDTWWKFYVDNDRTILSTSSENLSKKEGAQSKVYDIDDSIGLFKSRGFSWTHNLAEVEFLRYTYSKRIRAKRNVK